MKYFSSMLMIILTTGMALPANAVPRHQPELSSKSKVVRYESLKNLRKRHQRILHNDRSYFFLSGKWYQYSNGLYVTTAAPVGAVIYALPRDYISFGFGANRYFYFGGIYYRSVPTGYVVIEKPADAESIEETDDTGTEVAINAEPKRMIIYPAEGQSDEQKGRDKYECHEWASNESGFDPTISESDPLLRVDYIRAMGACLEARNYVVK